LYQVAVAVPKNLTIYMVKRKPDLFKAYCRAIGWHISHLFSRSVYENPTK